MSEHQLDDADIDTVARQAAGSFMAKVMPVEIDLPQLVAIDTSIRFLAFRVVPVG